jgi:glucosamine--fructose-6-phosphate aminotransferase (isomerizing)
MQEIAHKLASRMASLIVLTSDPKAFDEGPSFLKLPVGIPEWLSPIAYIIAGQMFAYELSIAKGKSPDTPSGLNKVTSTM